MSVTALLPYHPQEIRKQVLEVKEFIDDPKKDFRQRDFAIGELGANTYFLNTTINSQSVESQRELSEFFGDLNNNMVALLDSLDKMISIFNSNKFAYYTDAGWQTSGAPVNYKEYIADMIKDFMDAAVKAGHKYIPVAMRALLTSDVGSLVEPAKKQGIVIENKDEILRLLFAPAK